MNKSCQVAVCSVRPTTSQAHWGPSDSSRTNTADSLCMVLNCGCGFVAILDIAGNYRKMQVMRPQLWSQCCCGNCGKIQLMRPQLQLRRVEKPLRVAGAIAVRTMKSILLCKHQSRTHHHEQPSCIKPTWCQTQKLTANAVTNPDPLGSSGIVLSSILFYSFLILSV
ncbi:hypothetical protein E2542_SST04498 [Spatholobus suberectus]|nr:hypothetical protein E2542_SST04498 [Spatholobus suberectus]